MENVSSMEAMKTVVIHYKKLVDRKQFILHQFDKHHITNYEFIEIDRELYGDNL